MYRTLWEVNKILTIDAQLTPGSPVSAVRGRSQR